LCVVSYTIALFKKIYNKRDDKDFFKAYIHSKSKNFYYKNTKKFTSNHKMFSKENASLMFFVFIYLLLDEIEEILSMS